MRPSFRRDSAQKLFGGLAKSIVDLVVDPLKPPFILRQLLRRVGLSVEAVLLAKVA